jgi:hypothetical protein
VGHRADPRSGWRRRWLRATAGWFFGRWRANVLRIRTGNGGVPGVAALRAWRKRAATGPTLVFPEGVANRELGSMRAGVGRWLCGLDVPIVPVAVWWKSDQWNVAFGAPLLWTPRRDLRDVQLGLAMAELLPRELAPAWSALLDDWREAHSGRERDMAA